MSHNNSQSLKDTDTNLLVHMLANSEKLGSESKRWNYNGEKDPDLDDEHSKYYHLHILYRYILHQLKHFFSIDNIVRTNVNCFKTI
jgi:hypothetical protein